MSRHCVKCLYCNVLTWIGIFSWLELILSSASVIYRTFTLVKSTFFYTVVLLLYFILFLYYHVNVMLMLFIIIALFLFPH